LGYSDWDVPIKARSNRSNDLKEFKYNDNQLVITLIEEDTDAVWHVFFTEIQAFRSTSEECSNATMLQVPTKGGFFKSSDSDWLMELGKGKIQFLNNSLHFIICCYDEMIEVIADERTINILMD